MTGVRWRLSPRDWKAHVVDPCGLHPREFYMAICGCILVAGTPLSRVPQAPLPWLPAMTDKAAKDAALALDVAGHGLLTRFHDGCRCPWCVSTARERGCLCGPCVTVKTTGVYVIAPVSDRLTTAAVTGQPQLRAIGPDRG